MRILMVETSGRGFLCHYSHALCLGLIEAGHEVELVTGPDDELAAWRLPLARTRLRSAGPAAWLDLVRIVRRREPDVVHLQWVTAPLLMTVFALWLRRRGIRLVYTPHNILPHRGRWRRLPAFRLFYGVVDRIVARDRHLAWGLEEIFGLARARIAPLSGSPNLIAHPAIPRVCPPELGTKRDGECRLLFFGHGARAKGLAALLQALAAGAWPDGLHLVLAGQQVLAGIDPALPARLRRRIRLTTIERYLPADEAAGLFASADLLVLPYAKLCHSPLLDLAAAFRLPVLRTARVEGTWFGDDVSGLTVSDDEVATLRPALGDLAWHPERLERMRAALAGREDAATGLVRFAERQAIVYHEVCHGPASKAGATGAAGSQGEIGNGMRWAR